MKTIKAFLVLLSLLAVFNSYGQWSQITSPVGNDILDIQAVNDTVVYLAGETGQLHKSTDQGQNWVQLNTGITGIDTASAMMFFNELEGFVALNNINGKGIIARTVDGGASFDVMDSSQNAVYVDIDFSSTFFTGFAVGGWGKIMKSTDGGYNWSNVASSPTAGRAISAVAAPTDSIAYIVDVDGKVYKTSDVGNTWNQVFDAGVLSNHDIEAVDSATIVLLSGYHVHITNDMGATWTSDSISDKYMVDLELIGANSLIAVGENGRVALSTDGAVSWDLDTLTSAHLGTVSFFGPDLGFAGGIFGELYKYCLEPDVSYTVSETIGNAPHTATFNFNSTNAVAHWIDYGDGNSEYVTTPSATHIYTDPGFYDIAVIAEAMGGCTDTVIDENKIIVTTQINGMVTLQNGDTLSAGKAILYRKVQGQTKMDSVAQTPVSAGLYTFKPIPVGIYKVLIEPDFGQYPNQLPTYFEDAVLWHNAKFIVLTQDTFNIHVTLAELPQATGFATIRGLLREADTSGKRMGPGDPLKGINVSLVDKSSGNTVGFDVSTDDPDYNFTFTNVSAGSYRIHPDIAGVPVDTGSLNDVTITEEDTVVDNIIFIADSGEVTVERTSTGIEKLNNSVSLLDIYPNPATKEILIEVNVNEAYKDGLDFSIYNMIGKKIREINSGQLSAGKHLVKINIEDIPNGAYLLSGEGDGINMIGKIIIAR